MLARRVLSLSRLHHVRCDLCDSDDTSEVMKKRGDLYDYEFTIVRCRSCALAYVNPRLDDDAIAELYDEPYYRGEGFDRTVSYERDAALNLDAVRAINAGYVATLRDALGGLGERSILDVGCGMGGLVRSLCAEGANAVGTDSSPAALRACAANGTALTDTFEELTAKGRTFDAVSAIEVIEHTLSPKAFLRAALRLVAPVGVLFLSTGNWNLVRWLPGTPYLMPEGHIYYFTPVTMRRYFEELGVKSVNVLNRTWVGYRALRRVAPAGAIKPIASVFERLAPGYGPFPVGVRA